MLRDEILHCVQNDKGGVGVLGKGIIEWGGAVWMVGGEWGTM